MRAAPNAGVRAVPPDAVRASVRDLLTASSGFQALDSETRRAIAGSLARIAGTALTLAGDDAHADAHTRPPLARAQDAGSSFSGVAASKLASTTKQVLSAVSFP